jgi:hypothetical protein
MDRITIIKNEIDTDPLARGYAAMNNAEVATDMNLVYRTTNKSTMASTEVLNAIDKSEYNALSAANKTLIWNLLHIGDINPFGIEADLFVDAFGGGSTTITTLALLRQNNVSRGVEIGAGNVREGDVEGGRA